MVLQRNLQPNSPPQVNLICTNHGGLPMAVLHGRSPPPHTFVNNDLNFLQNIWSKFMVHSPDLFKDTLKRPITTIPPSIRTTHHDGDLPSPLSYTLADDNPPPLSMPNQRLQQNLRERHQFWNDGWTKWEAVQLAGKLEAKRVMAKTIPPLITTTHHDGGLPSPLSYILANDNLLLLSMPTQHSRHNLRERR